MRRVTIEDVLAGHATHQDQLSDYVQNGAGSVMDRLLALNGVAPDKRAHATALRHLGRATEGTPPVLVRTTLGKLVVGRLDVSEPWSLGRVRQRDTDIRELGLLAHFSTARIIDSTRVVPSVVYVNERRVGADVLQPDTLVHAVALGPDPRGDDRLVDRLAGAPGAITVGWEDMQACVNRMDLSDDRRWALATAITMAAAAIGEPRAS